VTGAISYAPFERELRATFRYGSKTVDTRRGFILRRLNTGKAHYAEASPLPGHSLETLEEVALALELGKLKSSPSLCFAMEALDYEGGNLPVRSNALLQAGTLEEARAELLGFLKQGYTHCKIKLGVLSVSEIADLMDANSDFLFRLDANRTLNPRSLDALIKQLDHRRLLDRIDYLEEPFEEIWQSADFSNAPLAFAADESAPTGERAVDLLSAKNPPKVVILKPTVQGSLTALSSLLDVLAEKKIRTVITSAIETEVGRRAILAFLSRHAREVAGISTGFLFKQNYLEDRASWASVPPISSAEQAWLDSLRWQESKW